MSWWSDGEKFDEMEGCEKCNFSKNPSAETCKGCKSGDYWNSYDWNGWKQNIARKAESLLENMCEGCTEGGEDCEEECPAQKAIELIENLDIWS